MFLNKSCGIWLECLAMWLNHRASTKTVNKLLCLEFTKWKIFWLSFFTENGDKYFKIVPFRFFVYWKNFCCTHSVVKTFWRPFKYAKKKCIFLHCLPRGNEVENKVFQSKNSQVWIQALNRVHVQKSILLFCFGKLR